MKVGLKLVVLLGWFAVAAAGCATTEHGACYSDAEVEISMRSTEAETLARLSQSNSNDIADAARTLAHERVK